MKNLKKLLLTTCASIFVISLTSTVNANFQSVKNATRYGEYYYNYIRQVRNMEKKDNVMGLNETIGSNLTSSSESNNIDVHMIKNTEYGTLALLAVSAEYGKQPTEFDTTEKKTSRYIYSGNGLSTSTGNIYGVYYEPLDYWQNHYVVAADNKSYNYLSGGSYGDVNSIYYNDYRTVSRINGDANLRWQGSGQNDGGAISRGYNGYNSIFSAYKGMPSSTYAKTHAVAVTGTGF